MTSRCPMPVPTRAATVFSIPRHMRVHRIIASACQGAIQPSPPPVHSMENAQMDKPARDCHLFHPTVLAASAYQPMIAPQVASHAIMTSTAAHYCVVPRMVPVIARSIACKMPIAAQDVPAMDKGSPSRKRMSYRRPGAVFASRRVLATQPAACPKMIVMKTHVKYSHSRRI